MIAIRMNTSWFRARTTQRFQLHQKQTSKMALLSMLVAGDDAGSKLRVMELVGKLGFEAADAGRLKNARMLEPFAMLWIDQAMKRGRGRDFAFALVN
jgi:predicted dinucleotide-binding enzyme